MFSEGSTVALVYRGDEIEAFHSASVAVVNGEGKLTHYFGDPEFVTMMRSAIKPFQLMPLILSGAADHYGFSPRQLAVMAGSHCGTDEHIAVVGENLAAADNVPEHLLCGTHWPLGMQAAGEYPLNGEDKDPLRHNCSGKHSGFLALSRFMKDPVEAYLEADSRPQQVVKQMVSDFTEFPAEHMPTGIDGCSAPNFPLALYNVALAFMKLATSRGLSGTLSDAVGRVRSAMLQYPVMVSGHGRFDLALSQALSGRGVCKIGAEAVEGVGLTDPPMGIAVKVHDGGERALGPVVVEVLRQLSILSETGDISSIRRYVRPEVRNARDIVTGHIVPDFELIKT
jgi:L-asparaginase II